MHLTITNIKQHDLPAKSTSSVLIVYCNHSPCTIRSLHPPSTGVAAHRPTCLSGLSNHTWCPCASVGETAKEACRGSETGMLSGARDVAVLLCPSRV